MEWILLSASELTPRSSMASPDKNVSVELYVRILEKKLVSARGETSSGRNCNTCTVHFTKESVPRGPGTSAVNQRTTDELKKDDMLSFLKTTHKGKISNLRRSMTKVQQFRFVMVSIERRTEVRSKHPARKVAIVAYGCERDESLKKRHLVFVTRRFGDFKYDFPKVVRV